MSIQYERLKNLNHCWLCGDSSSLHEHHIIPQAYGGVDGPLVTLCATCHNGVHHVADGRSEMRPTSWDRPDRLFKSQFLTGSIVKARILSSKSANKKVTVTLELSANEAMMLDFLKSQSGSSSRVNTLRDLIATTYRRTTNP
jgi:hypothetical protein